MKTYKLKSAFRRGSMLAAAVVVAGAAFLPAASSYADALNPLTDRSLTLSSSAPGWDYTDGSGNTTYAAPNSGANGQKTGNTFSFKVSTDSTDATGTGEAVQAFTFQYCTAPAGTCTAPGNNGTAAGVRNADSVSAKTSDLNIADPVTKTQVNNAGDAFFDSTDGVVTAIPNRDGTQGNYLVMWKDQGTSTWVPSAGWTMTVDGDEDGQTVTGSHAAQPGVAPTGKNNFITLSHATGVKPKAGSEFKIVFFGTNDNFITNPGSGAFFVKINTYKTGYNADQDAPADAANAANLVDGGVTVANVMNLGISIQTKVLETMDFSVGTVDPYTLSDAQLTTATAGERTEHGTCDPILNAITPAGSANTLLLGSESNENSLSTDRTYSTHSYFRLSSNASAGATVYYSGVTLSNTVGDQIEPIGPTKEQPNRGTEQFGLALANNSGDATDVDAEWKVNYKTERASGHLYENGADNAAVGLVALNEWDRTGTMPAATGLDPDWVIGSGQKFPQLEVYDDGVERVSLAPLTNYNQGAGIVNPVAGVYDVAKDPELVDRAQFAFDDTSNLIPVAIAQESSKVVDCASAKVRYIANIAATTPAGIYTTKINYIAAPQY